MFVQVHPVIDYHMRELCARPYPGHPQGCPNYGKRPGCPPQAPLFDQHFDLSRPIYAIYVNFDLVRIVNKAKPGVCADQTRQGKAWQGHARRLLRDNIRDFLSYHPGYSVVVNPEAMGVNVQETMARVGVSLTWQDSPKSIYKVALAGIRR